MPEKDSIRRITDNRKALHRFHVLEELECGIELKGTEVKSLRAGHCSVAEAYALVKQGELFLVGAHIPEYSHAGAFSHKPTRSRRLLAHKRELLAWERKAREKGITIVPLSVYFKGSRVKVMLGLCKGKKLHDKRASQREKDDRRDMDRAMSRRR